MRLCTPRSVETAAPARTRGVRSPLAFSHTCSTHFRLTVVERAGSRSGLCQTSAARESAAGRAPNPSAKRHAERSEPLGRVSFGAPCRALRAVGTYYPRSRSTRVGGRAPCRPCRPRRACRRAYRPPRHRRPQAPPAPVDCPRRRSGCCRMAAPTTALATAARRRRGWAPRWAPRWARRGGRRLQPRGVAARVHPLPPCSCRPCASLFDPAVERRRKRGEVPNLERREGPHIRQSGAIRQREGRTGRGRGWRNRGPPTRHQRHQEGRTYRQGVGGAHRLVLRAISAGVWRRRRSGSNRRRSCARHGARCGRRRRRSGRG